MSSDRSGDLPDSLVSLLTLMRLETLQAEGKHREILETVQPFLETFSVEDAFEGFDTLTHLGVAGLASFAVAASVGLGDLQRALEYAEKGVAAARLAGDNDFALARALNNRGWVRHEREALIEAERDYQAALDVIEQSNDPEVKELRTAVLNNIGHIRISRGEREQGLSDLAQTVGSAMWPLARLPGPIDELTVLNNRALVALEQGEVEAAEQYWRQALEHASTRSVKPGIHGIVLSNLAELYSRTGRQQLAIQQLEIARQIHSAEPESMGPLAIDLFNLATLFTKQGDQERALSHFKQAWDVIRTVAPRSLVALRVLRGLGMHRLVEGDFRRARAALKRGMDLYEQMRPSIALTETGQAGYFQAYRELLEIAMYLSLHQSWADELLGLIERAKGRYWIEHIASRQGTPASPDQESDPGIRLRAINEQLLRPGERSSHQTAQLRDERQRLEERLMTTLPARSEPTSPPYVESADQIRDLTGFNSVVLNYFVGPNATFLSYGHNRSLGGTRIDLGEAELTTLIDDFRIDLMSSSRRAGHGEAGRRLSQLLFGKVVLSGTRVRHLHLMPDGPLWYLPFDALPAPEWVPAANGEKRLFEIAPISYSPSITLLNQLRGRNKSLVPGSEWNMLTIAQPDAVGDQPALAGTAREVQQLADLVRGRVDLTTLEGATATKRCFLEYLPYHTHIHIAAHAEGHHEDTTPRIYLSGATPGEQELRITEVDGIPMQAELVFLSACSTSMGKISPGEGLMSLARAFLLAGCRCVVATLWPINDDSAPDFVILFYEGLLSGMSVAQALQSARLRFQQQGGRPRTWAAFQTFGDADLWEDRYSLEYLSRKEDPLEAQRD
jgi:CHAT domain-containing protein/tetratricopeptide (TPR) repeat protein